MKRIDNRVPVFKNEEEERAFWATHSPLEHKPNCGVAAHDLNHHFRAGLRKKTPSQVLFSWLRERLDILLT